MITLTVYLAPSGQWSGKICQGSEEIAGIAGCASAAEVEEAAAEMGYDIESIETI